MVTVSNKTELMRALDSADSGEKIVLENGNYGSLSLSGDNFSNATIVAENRNGAVFNMVSLNNVSNLTFDGVKFDYNSSSGTSKPFVFNGAKNVTVVNSQVDGMSGNGQGFWIKELSDFRVENSSFSNFSKALVGFTTDNLQVINNSFTGSAEDTMTFSRIDGALIQGNNAKMGSSDTGHRDFLQFYNTDGSRTSSDIVIRSNVFETSAGGIHGIYMANEVARQTGDVDDFYENVTIENNTVKSGQFLAIAVGEAVGVKIGGNVVLQSSGTSHASTIPMILIDDDARQISVTGNTTHKTPSAAGENWQPTSKPSGWTISDNKIVPLGTSSGSSGDSDGGGSGDGNADEFRYYGVDINGQERVVFNNVGFKEGDIIMLKNFDVGTFNHYAGDNSVGANTEKTHVWINSLTDIQEIVTAAQDVTAVFQTNDLVMRVAQDAGTLDIVLPGWADDYKDTFNANLF